jgi:hypothetical protein
MPSTKDPNTTVNPGPGKVPAGTVSASALLFLPGGGGGAGLEAHITDPVDAHMASAIGINPVYTPTGEAILSSVGGLIDGENVEDFIAMMKDLLPARPNTLGRNLGGPNSGVPTWPSAVKGGFARSGAVVPTHTIYQAGTNVLFGLGVFFPADRGVLALYRTTTTSDYFDSSHTTLVGAVWLGSAAPPAGLPSANFLESSRTGAQADHTGGGGLDIFALTHRLPNLKDYSAYAGIYADYGIDFFRYQLASFAMSRPLSNGDNGSYLLVHWRETFAVSLSAIQPVNLTSGNMVAANVYSAVPIAGSFDVGDIETVNRHNIFVDPQSSTAPSGALFNVTVNGSPTLIATSGVQHYSGAGLSWTVDLRVNNLFNGSFYLGTTASPPDIPTGFTTDYPPIRFDFATFGGTALDVPYTQLKPTGGSLYSLSSAPLPGDQGQFASGSVTIPSPTPFTRSGQGVGVFTVELSKPYQNVATSYEDTNHAWLFNSFPQSGGSTASTTTLEPMVDERYRYVSTYPASVATVGVIPAGGDHFNSAAVLTAGGDDLQIIGNQVVYPTTDYSAAVYRPTGQPNYAAVLAADAANHLRRYVRAFDTGISRNTGRIRVNGLAASAFASLGVFTGDPVADHPGGAILEIKVPGVTGWLDLGRIQGDPDLTTVDGHGCQTGLSTSGSDVVVSYNTTSPTGNYGLVFPLFLRLTLIKGPGTTLGVNEFEWLTP